MQKSAENINYKSKINQHFIGNHFQDELNTNSINEFVKFLANCFTTKNNFYVKNFNPKSIVKIKKFFIGIRTNILSTETFSDYLEFFNGITYDEINCLIFIISNYVELHIDNSDDDDNEKRKIYINMIYLLNGAKNNLKTN